MTPDADAIADCVLSTFDKLPPKRQPRARADGSREWVPLAGIVLANDDGLSCVSLGTGMKCLPSTKLPFCNGTVLHDWHAEVLAIRAFNRYLLDQCLSIVTSPHRPSQYIRQRAPGELTEIEHQPFAVKEDVKIFIYCSEAPCGDASMELVMNQQEDATPWTSPAPTISAEDAEELGSVAAALRGRSHFSHLGSLRLKPSRPDAPPTFSKSCTDKLAHTQATSLLSSVTSLLIGPDNAYINTLILPHSQHVPTACERAFSRTGTGRMKGVTEKVEEKWQGGYRWKDFHVEETQREFVWSRRAVGKEQKAVACNMSAVWTPGWQETLIGGALQGRKQFDPRGASAVCRNSMWKMAAQIAAAAGAPRLIEALGRECYKDVKESDLLKPRKDVKDDVRDEALKGWIKNTGDDAFGLEAP